MVLPQPPLVLTEERLDSKGGTPSFSARDAIEAADSKSDHKLSAADKVHAYPSPSDHGTASRLKTM